MLDLDKLAFPGGNVQVVETSVRDCAVESVVVYADRAEVKRIVPVRLEAGKNEVIVHGLSACTDKNSIRVEGKGKAIIITDVIYSSKSSEEVQNPGTKEEYEAIKEEIKSCKLDIRRLEFKQQVLQEEKELLDQFAAYISNVQSAKNKEDSLPQLVDKESITSVMEFFEKYESKIADLDSRLSKVAEDIYLLQEKIHVLKENSEQLNPQEDMNKADTVRSVHVGLEISEEVEGVLFVSYVVSHASWRSAYDVRVFTNDKKMKVQYYGFIKQQTGEDWKDAQLSLSTAQPSIGGSSPDLSTRILRFKKAPFLHDYTVAPFLHDYSYNNEYFRDSLIVDELEADDLEEQEVPMEMLGSSFRSEIAPYDIALSLKVGPSFPLLEVETAKVNAGMYNTTYAIPRASSIPADNAEHKVTVALVDLNPEFHYNSVPRLSPHSFLQAKARNTSPYTMLAGPANIFMDNNFIAKSELTDISPNEEFTTSLGVDQSLRITCQPVGVVHNTRSGLRSKTTSITYTHKFQVKNTKSHPVSIHLSEQVPLSSDEKVKVGISEPVLQKSHTKCPLPSGHAILNESNNMEWHVSVNSGEELELRLVYSVEYPAQDHVKGLPKH